MKESSFSSRIKELRTSLGLTQVEFAEKIGTTQATLSSYENTDKTPSLDIVRNIADTFSISIDWLLGRSEKQSLSSKLETYADLIKVIMLIEDAPKISKEFRIDFHPAQELGFIPYNTLLLDINDKHLVEFFEEWKEILSIRRKSPSGEKIYSIWLKDIYERYNFPLEDAAQSGGDEVLPFT